MKERGNLQMLLKKKTNNKLGNENARNRIWNENCKREREKKGKRIKIEN